MEDKIQPLSHQLPHRTICINTVVMTQQIYEPKISTFNTIILQSNCLLVWMARNTLFIHITHEYRNHIYALLHCTYWQIHARPSSTVKKHVWIYFRRKNIQRNSQFNLQRKSNSLKSFGALSMYTTRFFFFSFLSCTNCTNIIMIAP